MSSINNLTIGWYIRALVAANLQVVTNMINDDTVWATSLVGDGSTHRLRSFFAPLMRVCFRGGLLNLRLVAMPMLERHTPFNMLNMLFKFLDALYSKWRFKLMGMSSDGENTMTEVVLSS